jgi:hypothetical protein
MGCANRGRLLGRDEGANAEKAVAVLEVARSGSRRLHFQKESRMRMDTASTRPGALFKASWERKAEKIWQELETKRRESVRRNAEGIRRLAFLRLSRQARLGARTS